MLTLLCSGCGTRFIEKGNIDQAKLYDNKEKYGVVLFRGVFFNNVDQMEMFYQDDENIKLSESNDLYVSVMPSTKYDLYLIGGTSYGSKNAEEKEKLFTKTPRVVEFLNPKSPTFYPQYFYTLKMLPEGEYYINKIQFTSPKGKSYLESSYSKKDSPYYFTVRSGQINYLGDLYLSSPMKNGGFFSKEYNLGSMLLNESDKAEAFMKIHHSDIQLPFTTNLIQRR